MWRALTMCSTATLCITLYDKGGSETVINYINLIPILISINIAAMFTVISIRVKQEFKLIGRP